MTRTSESRPILVVGGGPAGCSAALTLARRGLPVVLCERTSGYGNPIGETLDPAATAVFERMGLAGVLHPPVAIECPGNRSAWGGHGAQRERHFLLDGMGPGWHLDRCLFNGALVERVLAAGVVVRLQTEVRLVSPAADGCWNVHISDTSGISGLEATFVVDATGRSARIARQMGANRHAFDRLTAVVGSLRARGESMRDATTLVEACEIGWWYSAMVPDGSLVVGVFTDPDLVTDLSIWRVEGWLAVVSRYAEMTARRIENHQYHVAGDLHVAAAYSSVLEPCAGEGWAAAGDAAAAFDPLSSHGIVSALVGGEQAAWAILGMIDGDERAIERYAGWTTRGYARYLRMWRSMYKEEDRWKDERFWRRRRN